MARGRKYSSEEIIPKLREAEVLMSQGTTQDLAAKQIGVSTQTLIRWRKEYGGLRMDQAKRMKELEKENARLKRLLADAELDKAILKEAASGNF
jgi:transposase-like protein